MKFDLTTFVFQIINFVVLLFILRRLLYKPVRDIIEKRRAMTEKTVLEAEKTKQEAVELRQQYEQEMDRLKDLRQQTLEKLQEEALEEKKRLLGTAREEAGRLIEKEKAVFDAEKRRLEAEIKDEAIDTACVMGASLLKDLSDEELHKAAYRRLLEELEKIAPDLSNMAGKDEALNLELASAYPLSGEEVERVSATLRSHLARKVTVKALTDKDLIAGARIRAYDKVYNFSLSGQMDLFRKRLKETV